MALGFSRVGAEIGRRPICVLIPAHMRGIYARRQSTNSERG